MGGVSRAGEVSRAGGASRAGEVSRAGGVSRAGVVSRAGSLRYTPPALFAADAAFVGAEEASERRVRAQEGDVLNRWTVDHEHVLADSAAFKHLG